MSGERLVIAEARLLDTASMQYHEPVDILVEGDRIEEIRPSRGDPGGGRWIGVAGMTVLPGLIDAHVHVIGTDEDYARLARTSPYLVAARASAVLRDMLMRGFTTVRDAGGADAGLRAAVAEGAFAGPRLFVSDLGLAQTGGQGDFRAPGEPLLGCPCCGGYRTLTRLVDGVAEVRSAVREMLRAGADQIKVMASGGIASGVPIARLQFSDDEITAMVGEAGRAGTYVMAHAYTDDAVRRSVRLGIRSIEHATHLDDVTCREIVAAGAFIVPTLSVYEAHAEGDHPKSGLFAEILDASLESLARAREHGVAIGHGSDLTGHAHAQQSREFLLKREVLTPREVIRSATIVNARILGREGELGVLAPGAMADLVAIDGDPLEDLACLADPGRCLRLIVKGGTVHKNTLGH